MRTLKALAVLVAVVACAHAAAQAAPSLPVERLRMSVDVLVYGSEPEGVIAAVAAAREGAETVLITPDPRIGGLFVLGELNVLDLKTQPFDYQLGLFDTWWRLVGRDEAFDVTRAEAAFEELLRDAGVERFRSVAEVFPIVAADGSRVAGAEFVDEVGRGWQILARQLIDASGDADLAAMAGAAFDFGWERFGVDQRMADTLVFRLGGVDWGALVAGVNERGRAYAVAKPSVVWGHFGGYPAAYTPTDPSLRLRGLNLGRQDDGTVLVNALLIYDIDPLDAASRAAGRERAMRELPSVVAYLAAAIPGLENARLAGAAETLYVRESRHLRSLCDLRADDALGNRVTAFDVAAGGYPLDAQTYTRFDSGFVFGVPVIYGGRLCMGVSRGGPDDLWVVGRSAGYDPVAFSSARVVPFGMAMAEAAGLAAALAAASNDSATSFVLAEPAVHEVRTRLTAHGAYLPPVTSRPPVGPVSHPSYDAFRTLVARGLSVAGYDNDPRLSAPVTALSFAYLLSNVATRFYFRDDVGQTLVDAAVSAAERPDAPLDAAVAAATLEAALCALLTCPTGDGWAGLLEVGVAASATPPAGALDRGAAYELAAGLAKLAGSE